MIKLVTFAGYDSSGPHIFPIEPDRERTIGHIKMARALPPKIEHYIRCAKPIRGKTQLLIDAMGAGEYYGSNVNGDYFPEDALRHEGPEYGHETFMHYAYPYKHHVNKDPKRAYGEKVTLAAYDPTMHRVLLIVRIDDSKCQDILSDLANGHYWDVSMGCKVPWDECSICRNRARNRGEYCPHLRYQMNKILPDGRRVFAYNHLPKFFDISFVTIGAEKASHVLKKVASPHALSSTPPMSSAAMAEIVYGKQAADKKAEIEKDVPSQPPGSLEGVTPSDKRKLGDHLDAAGALKSCEPLLPAKQLALSGVPLQKILGTIAACGIDLRPEEYQRIVLVKQGAAPLADYLERRSIVFDEHGPATFPKWARPLGPDDVSEKVALELSNFLPQRSCYPEILLGRLKSMSKVADFQGYRRNSQWYPMNDEELRASSGKRSFTGAMAALAGGFLVFRKAFPGLEMGGGRAVQAISKHPWLLPILIGAGIGASVGFGESRQPLSLAPYAARGGVDAIKVAAYHQAKTAGLYPRGLGLAPLAYIYSDVNASKRHTKTAFDFFAKARPAEASGLTRYSRTPSSLMEKAAMLEGSYDARIYGLVDRVARLRKG